MSYCINPWCEKRKNFDEVEICSVCGTPLLIDGRFRLLKPLHPISLGRSTEIFEVVDKQGVGYGGTWVTDPGTHKVMKVLRSRNPKLIQMMKREAEVLQLLVHPGIPKVYLDDSFTVIPNEGISELHCFVMQKFEGKDLESWLKGHGFISQSRALNWLQQLIEILDHVHQAGFFHRDIKPSNIILQPSGELALIDFGGVRQVTETYLAKVSGNQNTTGISDPLDVTVVMTAGYAPPEQFNGKGLPQSDFFALGRTFAHLLTGIHPSSFSLDQQTGGMVWREKALQIDKIFADFVDELMAIAPGKRPQNTQVILQRLKRLPRQSQLNRVVRAKPFQALVVVLFMLAAYGCYELFLFQKAKYYFELGLQNEAVGLREEAKRNYKKSIQNNPGEATTHFHLAFNCHNLNDFSCAYRHYQEALRLRPTYWKAHYDLGSLYDEQGKYAQAEQHYKLAVKIDENLALDAMNNIARLRNRNGDYSGAVDLALQALQKAKDPITQAALYKNLGWAMLKQNHYAKAKTYLEKSLNLDPQRADSYCLLAQVQDIQKDIAGAKLSWEACLRVSSELPEVEGWRQQLLNRLFD